MSRTAGAHVLGTLEHLSLKHHSTVGTRHIVWPILRLGDFPAGEQRRPRRGTKMLIIR